jgi:beta-phosphoglucomutase-like phosphatase (HAD superfamily)
MTINKMSMKEFSVVSVPANAEAIATAKSLDGNQKAELRVLANAYARKMLESETGVTEIEKNIESLETLVATLREVALKSKTQEESAEPITKRVVLKQAQVVVQQAEKVIKVIKKEDK